MYPTPNTQDHKTNPGEDLENWKKRAKEKKKQGINLHFALRQAVQMYPTPRARDHFPPVNQSLVSMNSKGWTTTRKGTGVRYGATLPDVVNKMYPTPRAALGMSFTLTKNLAKLRHKKYLETEIAYLNRNNLKPGGKLNPNFVEFLMGYAQDWTKIEQTESKVLETQSFPKSPMKSEKQS